MKDKILENLIEKEVKRQKETINLIASENFVSKDVLEALGSVLTNKYSEGYPEKRYYAGNEIIDQIEMLAQERALKAFKLKAKNWSVNVQPYSGSPANMAVYYALLKPGEKIMGMGLPFGGHLTHGWKVNFSGRFYKTIQYGVQKNGYLDYGEIRKLAKKERPKIIVAGATAYSRIIDFKKFSAIAKEVNAYLMVDMAHIAGLVAAGVHPSPFPYADVVTTTTHKTLRGPRGAMIFSNRESRIAKHYKIDITSAIDKAVFPGLQGGPHNNQTAAIAQCLFEASQPSFKKYAEQIVKNAKTLAKKLREYDFQLISDGTDNHLILINLADLDVSGRQAQSQLEKAGIVVNKNTVPYDNRSPFDPSGIRLGTPVITSRGMKEKEVEKIAELIYRVLIKKENPTIINREVKKICNKFPI
ncbi:MAG: serine hydroxymethyltransferase [bacterium]|nr:serine hydroxymethyltransferase [bacterium]